MLAGVFMTVGLVPAVVGSGRRGGAGVAKWPGWRRWRALRRGPHGLDDNCFTILCRVAARSLPHRALLFFHYDVEGRDVLVDVRRSSVMLAMRRKPRLRQVLDAPLVWRMCGRALSRLAVHYQLLH